MFEIELTSPGRLTDERDNWCFPRMGIIPSGAEDGSDLRVMTLQRVEREGSDLFHGLHSMQWKNGKWSEPQPIKGFERRCLGGGREITVCDFTPRWHAVSGALLGTGHTVTFQDGGLLRGETRSTVYALYDPEAGAWGPWRELEMPSKPRFLNAGAGSTQRVDLPDGDILLPIYFREPAAVCDCSTVVRCRLEDGILRYLEHGTELTLTTGRGFAEPSLSFFRNRFYLTLRNDDAGYVAVSDDGLDYSEPVFWKWDDGSDLGSYNTQQHWVTHSGGIFLVYTRRGAGNDHIPRHRAPLFIAEVDPDALCVIRSTERILMPNRGALLGNFAVTEVNERETVVTDAELLRPAGCERFGADGSIWIARLLWNAPNRHRVP